MLQKPFKTGLWLGLVVACLAVITIYFLVFKKNKAIKAATLYGLQLENENLVGFDLNNFKGKHVFINCWQSWCGPCVAEMPMIDSAFQMIDKDQWVFMVINDEDWETINHFKSQHTFQMPLYKSRSNFVRNRISTYPTSIILNGKGEIVMQEVGMLPYNAKEFVQYLNTFQ
jgi:thiol-disulfide isomerase/thioredoxin